MLRLYSACTQFYCCVLGTHMAHGCMSLMCRARSCATGPQGTRATAWELGLESEQSSSEKISSNSLGFRSDFVVISLLFR